MARNTCCLAMLLGLLALPARADFFALEVDGQAGYLRLDNLERPATSEATTLSGGSFGVRGKLEILFLCVIVDYQHMFNNADFLHAGLGADFKLPLGIVKPFARGSVGLIMLAASEGAFSFVPLTQTYQKALRVCQNAVSVSRKSLIVL